MNDSKQIDAAAKQPADALHSVVLLDGGMGQELMRRSDRAPAPLWSAQVLLDQPDLVESVHADFIAAGATVVTLNNYSATRQRLNREGRPDMFEELHRQAIQVAQNARANQPIALAGCLPPLVASYRPDLMPDMAEADDSYAELVALQAPSVDLFVCETMTSIREAESAAKAACASALPVWVALTVKDEDGLRLRSGESLSDAVTALWQHPIQALLINCSSPEAIDSAMPVMLDKGPMSGAYANGFTSIAALQPGGTVATLQARQDLGPEQYAARALQWVSLGAQIVGGCCEVGPEHIATLKQKLLEESIEIVSPQGFEAPDHKAPGISN